MLAPAKEARLFCIPDTIRRKNLYSAQLLGRDAKARKWRTCRHMLGTAGSMHSASVRCVIDHDAIILQEVATFQPGCAPAEGALQCVIIGLLLLTSIRGHRTSTITTDVTVARQVQAKKTIHLDQSTCSTGPESDRGSLVCRGCPLLIRIAKSLAYLWAAVCSIVEAHSKREKQAATKADEPEEGPTAKNGKVDGSVRAPWEPRGGTVLLALCTLEGHC